MNDGVKVLIERMKTNPEDFTMTPTISGAKEGKFYWVRKKILSYLSEPSSVSPTPSNAPYSHLLLLKQEDLDALVEAFREMHQQEFTDKVMADLFSDGPSEVDTAAEDSARYAAEYKSLYTQQQQYSQQQVYNNQHNGYGNQQLAHNPLTPGAPSGGVFASLGNIFR